MQKRFGANLSPTIKYWIFLVGIIVTIFAVILGSFAASYLHLSAAEQALADRLFDKLLAFPFLGSLLLVAIISTLVSLIFRYYIIPVLRMAEQTRMITAANAKHRIVTRGAQELQVLARVINESAEAYQQLQAEVDDRVDQANQALKLERNRFLALISELPNGVVVCNTDGLVQLYNPLARDMLKGAGEAGAANLGIGRSIFGLLDRDPLVHALEVMHHDFTKGQAKPALGLMTRLCGEHFVRVNMAPVTSQEQDAPSITGFVLTLENITDEIEAVGERDRELEHLIDAVQASLGNIHQGLDTICELPDAGNLACEQHRQAIARVSADLEEHLALARNLYSSHRRAYGNRENVLSETLLAIMAKDVRERFAMSVEIGEPQEIWLAIDSYAIVQALTNLAGLLKAEREVTTLHCTFSPAVENRTELSVSWPAPAIPCQLLSDWQTAPLFKRPDGQTDTPQTILALHGGSLTPQVDENEQCTGLILTLPVALTEKTVGLASRIESRPVSYEFDLFNQPRQKILGDIPLEKLIYVAFDTETTGLDPSEGDEIIQIGAIRIVNGRLMKEEIIDQLVNPGRPIPPSSVKIHGIEPELLVNAPPITEVLPQFYAFARDAVLVAHNAAFDMRFLQLKEEDTGLRFDQPVLDTLLLSSLVHPNQESHSLDAIATRFNLRIIGRHTAFGDALVTAEILLKLLPLLQAQGIRTLDDALQASTKSRYVRLKY